MLFLGLAVQLGRCRRPRTVPGRNPAIENESRLPVTCTVTFEPVTNRIPEARAHRARPPAVERQGHTGQVGPGVAGAVGHDDDPALRDRAVDGQPPERIIAPLPVAWSCADGTRWSCAPSGSRLGDTPVRPAMSATAAARARRITPPPTRSGAGGPREWSRRMVHRSNVGGGRVPELGVCVTLFGICERRRGGAQNPQGSSLTFSCTETGASSLTPSSTIGPALGRGRRRGAPGSSPSGTGRGPWSR